MILAHVADNALYYALFAFVIGGVLDIFVVGDGLVAVFVLPFIVGVIWMIGGAMEESKRLEFERGELTKHCVKIGERDPRSIWEYGQVGYRCPSEGGATIERWINQTTDKR